MSPHIIDENTSLHDIVIRDYRSADIFEKNNIDPYNEARTSLIEICRNKGIDVEKIKKELEAATRIVQVSNSLPFDKWPISFLIDYIQYIHHEYLKDALPKLKQQVDELCTQQKNSYPYPLLMKAHFDKLCKEMIPHMEEEEKIIFPYIKQIVNAYSNKDVYASLLVRTLRKPVEGLMHTENRIVNNMLLSLRKITNNYSPPDNNDLYQRVIFRRIHEVDNDLVQHVHLENDILFPKAIAIERELLKKEKG